MKMLLLLFIYWTVLSHNNLTPTHANKNTPSPPATATAPAPPHSLLIYWLSVVYSLQIVCIYRCNQKKLPLHRQIDMEL